MDWCFIQPHPSPLDAPQRPGHWTHRGYIGGPPGKVWRSWILSLRLYMENRGKNWNRIAPLITMSVCTLHVDSWLDLQKGFRIYLSILCRINPSTNTTIWKHFYLVVIGAWSTFFVGFRYLRRVSDLLTFESNTKPCIIGDLANIMGI